MTSDEAASDDAASDEATTAASDGAASDNCGFWTSCLQERFYYLQEQLDFRSAISSGAA